MALLLTYGAALFLALVADDEGAEFSIDGLPPLDEVFDTAKLFFHAITPFQDGWNR